MKSFIAETTLWALLLFVAINCIFVESANIRIKKETQMTEMDTTQDEMVLEEPLMTFGSDLFNQLRDEKNNVIFSPMSVHSALNLVLLGTENGSVSEKELVQALGYSKANGPVQKFHESYAKVIGKFKEIAAGRKEWEAKPEEERQWVKPPPTVEFWTTALTKGPQAPLPEYRENVKRYYDSAIHKVASEREKNVELLKTVNSWAKKAGFSNDVLTPDDLEKEFSMLLMSAIRAEAHWIEEFVDEEAKGVFFYNHGKKDQPVKKGKVLSNFDFKAKLAEFSMIPEHSNHSSEIKKKYPDLYNELAALEFRTIDLSLKGNLSYTIIEPFDAADGKGLMELEKALLTNSRLRKAFQIMDGEDETKFNRLRMPQFKFESDIGLNDHLKSLGIRDMFEPRKARITRMSEGAHFISDVKHKAVIEVDKEGLKAAAITFIRALPASAHHYVSPIRIAIENPYMFVIRYNKLPLFVGHLVQL